MDAKPRDTQFVATSHHAKHFRFNSNVCESDCRCTWCVAVVVSHPRFRMIVWCATRTRCSADISCCCCCDAVSMPCRRVHLLVECIYHHSNVSCVCVLWQRHSMFYHIRIRCNSVATASSCFYTFHRNKLLL